MRKSDTRKDKRPSLKERLEKAERTNESRSRELRWHSYFLRQYWGKEVLPRTWVTLRSPRDQRVCALAYVVPYYEGAVEILEFFGEEEIGSPREEDIQSFYRGLADHPPSEESRESYERAYKTLVLGLQMLREG